FSLQAAQMLKNTGAVLLTGLTISWVWRGIRTRALQSGNSPGPVPFEHDISDAHAPVNQWAAGVGDINGDGFVDVVSSGSAPGSGGLYWYEYPTWAKHVIDGNGKIDVVIANQKWELPRPVNQSEDVIFFQNSADSWTPVVVSKTYGEGTCIADLNGDGKPDIVKGGWWLENPRDSLHDPWPEH